MAAFDETDRSAILLRFFENKTLREVGDALGASEDAAQKRVSRAVERLREFFSMRNVTIGADWLAILISTNAVQSAPVGLVATISTAALLVGTTATTSTAIIATKAIAMTTLQKPSLERRSSPLLEPESLKHTKPRNCASRFKRSGNSKRRWLNKFWNCGVNIMTRQTGWPDCQPVLFPTMGKSKAIG